MDGAARRAVRIDAAGNFRAVYPALQPDAPRLLIGSHLDTVPNAGAYDGILGVVLAVALLEELRGTETSLCDRGGWLFGGGRRTFRHAIHRQPRAGRQAGPRTPRPSRCTRNLRAQGDRRVWTESRRDFSGRVGDKTLGYLEFHIEQGPVLEKLNLPLAAVEAIAGQSRLEFTFLGRANHAGTTPMHLRCDAIAGAAEWIGAVERVAHEIPGLVATVGKIEAKPGATNVIAGEARMTLDVRHSSDGVRIRAVDDLIRQAQEIAARRGLSVRESTLLSQPAVAMNPFLIDEIEKAIVRLDASRIAW